MGESDRRTNQQNEGKKNINEEMGGAGVTSSSMLLEHEI